ncbi:MAG: T9SS type A sorting domain-containing protein [Bacteroidales bacterium]|nr:T9SS type A sorting domain-containing protein [Bacteroidales bacterium]
MAKYLKYTLLLFLICSADCFSRDISPKDSLLSEIVARYGQARVTVPFRDKKELQYFLRNVSVSSVKDKKMEMVISPLTLSWFISQHTAYEILRIPDARSLETSSGTGQAMEWESYPTYPQYDSIMHSFVARYPLLCSIDTIGTSIRGRLILVLRISAGVQADETRPGVFFTSTIHGDETGGFILMLRLADYLLRNYGSDERIQNLLDNLEIWINPLSNPDGTYRPGDTIISPVRFNANGYDLNRNFPDPATPNTVMQKETIDMVSFLRRQKFVLSANFHSGAEVVNYPWDSRRQRHADDNWFYGISRRYADTVHRYSPPLYMRDFNHGITNGYDWYSINGGRQDFVTRELQGRELTVELHDRYITPVSQLDLLWQYNYRSLLAFAENALYGIHGSVSDSETGEPVAAKVLIKGYDRDSSHVYSDTAGGNFIRMLAPGIYNLSFTAKGYVEKEIRSVIVEEGTRTSLSVAMTPFAGQSDTTDSGGLVIFPNPSADRIYVILPPRQYGMVNVRVYSVPGLKAADYFTEGHEDIPLSIDVSGLKDGVYILQLRNSLSGMTDRIRFVVAGKR